MNRLHRRGCVWLMVVLFATGCATERGATHVRGSGGTAGLVARSVMGAAVQGDAFEQVLGAAGLADFTALPPREAPVTPEDAAALYEALLGRAVTLRSFGPRLAVGHLLRAVMEGEEEVGRAELLSRLALFQRFAVLRPDGYMAWALSGNTQQRVGPVTWRDGGFRAGPFELGRFYSGASGAFRHVDAKLQPTGTVLAEVYDDADYVNRTLDGAEEALVELALAMGQLLSHPVDSLAALRQLPAGLAALIASSPEYLERLRYMTRGEQVQELSRLCTTLVATVGTAAGTTRSLSNVARGPVSVPALSLSMEGALMVERVAVPVGRAVTVLGGGPGAAIILQRANATGQGAPAGGPGRWGPSREAMSRRAARYQEQIGGRPVEEAYWVGGVGKGSGGVKFDGFREGVLLEAKGPGYANKFMDNLAPKPWFRGSGARQLVDQAERQVKAAKGGPVRWHVAEEKAAAAIKKLLQDAEVVGIEVVHTPMIP